MQTATDIVTKTDVFDVDAMTAVLPKAGYGWLGVFIVTAVIVAAVYLLNRFGSNDK